MRKRGDNGKSTVTSKSTLRLEVGYKAAGGPLTLLNEEQWGSWSACADIARPMHMVAAAGQTEIVIVAGCLASAASFLGSGWHWAIAKKGADKMHDRQTCGVVGPEQQLCLGQSSLALCGIAWLSARPGWA